MTYNEVEREAKKYASVILLNRIVPEWLRKVFIILGFMGWFSPSVLLGALAIYSRYPFIPDAYADVFKIIVPYAHLLLISVLITFPVFLFFYSLHTYSRYFVLGGVARVFGNHCKRSTVSYEAAKVLLAGKDGLIAESLMDAKASGFILTRLGVDQEEVLSVVASTSINQTVVLHDYNGVVTIGSLWKSLYDVSDPLKELLLSKKIQKETVFETCDWIDRITEIEKRKSAWWWRENLSKIRGIGKSLSYGDATIISKYAYELVMDRSIQDMDSIILHQNALTLLEEALSKSHGANAVLVGSKGSGRHAIVKILSRMINQGTSYSEIEHKRVFEFDSALLSSLDAQGFVTVLDRCFEEAVLDGNIIFVFNDMDTIFDIGQKLGVDVFRIIERYCIHSSVSVVCICDQAFYQHASHKSIFDAHFDVIHIEDVNIKLLVPYIQEYALHIEKTTGVVFGAYVIRSIAGALTKYFVEDSPLLKTSELMYKVATMHSTSGGVLLDEDALASVIKSLTGVSTGEIHADERDVLLRLEDMLHENVMGQHEAIKAIASTMRRSRTGLVGTTKPIGSFLFLGPTGVGKTETAKALAKVFFGNENYMSRIDMNEYTMSNSSYRLLGDKDNEGDIAKHIHEHPYGVFLLDEFEKATTDVKDIFLRILDEGVYTNGAGKLISARTQIVIATSNAGSRYIQESELSANSTKQELEVIKNELVRTIIADGLFRPELVNRFDAVIVFHPLSEDSRVLVARKMLDALKERALAQGYNITFTDKLVTKILSHEGDGQFGGRAIQRNIQSEVEDALARKVIEGNLQVGDSLTIDAEDIE